MSFLPAGSLSPFGAPVLRNGIIANSVVAVVNVSVKASSGFIALGTAGALVFGHIQSIASPKDLGMLTTGVAGASVGSFVGSFTAASDNQTVAMNVAKCDVSKFTLYSATLTAAIGTTTGSNLLGYSLDLSTSAIIDEATALTTTGQYMGHGVDPVNSANVIVNIFESQIFGV